MESSTPRGLRSRLSRRTRAVRFLPAAALALALAPAPAAAGAGEGGEAREDGASPRVELEELLQLPASSEYSVERRGGATPGEWRSRFRRLREDLAAERRALDRAEAELEKRAGGVQAWKVGPALPGGGGAPAAGEEAPLDYELRQRIRRHRDEIERLERKLRELQVEANLAGVPSDWRGGEPRAERPDAEEREDPPLDRPGVGR